MFESVTVKAADEVVDVGADSKEAEVIEDEIPF